MAKVTFCKTWFLSKFKFFCHNFWTRNARWLIKGSKYLYYSVVSNKNVESKNWFLALVPRAQWPQLKRPNPTLLVMSPTKSQKSKIFLCFKYPNQKTCCIFWGFEQLTNTNPSSIGWRVRALQSDPRNVAHSSCPGAKGC